MNLYRVNVIDTFYTYKKVKPVYVVTETKEKALEYVQKHLRDCSHKAGKATHLGTQLGTYIYPGKETTK